MARLEYKYYIPLLYLNEVRNDLSPYLVYDYYTQLMHQKEYTVRSIYLDTHQLFTYQQKLAGIKERNKYRIRGYNNLNDNSVVYLEIKRKDVEYISKDRAPLHYKDLESFIKTKNIGLILNSTTDTKKKRNSARNFLYYYHLYNLQPKVIVSYEREAYECKFGSGLRITLDKNVRTRSTSSFTNLYSDENMIHSLIDFFVLEVKFHKVLPSWLPVIMKKYNIIRESVPKYAMSIDAVMDNNHFNYLN